MPTENTHIKIPRARAEQIKEIAQTHGITIADLVARWVRQEIEAGAIPAGLPGVKVVINTNDNVSITLNDLMLDPTRAEAVEFAQKLREISAGHDAALKARFAAITRRGDGFSVTSPFTGRKFPMSRSIAGEVAEQIEAALN